MCLDSIRQIHVENLPVVASLILRVASVETDEASNESVIVTSRRTEFIIFVETEPER